SGKIHLQALPEAFTQKSVENGFFQGELETELAGIWEKTLGQSIPHREANFFELGGDSLSITQLAFNLRKSFKRSVAIKDLYAYPVLKDMAEFIVSKNQGQHSLPEIPQAMEDRTLADDLKPKNFPTPVPALSPGQHVLVTGAPGFIGLWILGTLLKRGDLHIKCMETCQSPDEGMASLQNKLKEAGCWKESYSERLSVISAALDKPNLGLQQDQWDNLANETDIIVHSGFHVNLAQSYTVLRPSNVLGTREVLRLACEGSIPMHYIGSTSIIDFVTRAHETTPVQEDDPFATCTGIQTGYILSRWVADHMIRRAGEQGLPVAIYRMTTVGGDADSLYCDTDEIYWRLVRVFTQTALMPQSKRVIDLVPVDEAAKAVVTLASQNDSYGRSFHMNSPRKLPWETIHKYLSNAGYNITMTSSEKWAEHLRNLSPEKVDGNVRILLSMINDNGYDANTSLTMGCDATNMTLKQLNCEINPVSEDLFQGYLDRMVKQGWLEPAQ
ncbi:MAG: thioester reductase domain-containing protein, partial [Spirochaetales bacterium]|nr:thioester reductase domain-containing protein [Spirochaetales bacterium]